MDGQVPALATPEKTWLIHINMVALLCDSLPLFCKHANHALFIGIAEASATESILQLCNKLIGAPRSMVRHARFGR